MGLFGFGKKKYEKNVSRDNEFLKEYAIKVNGLLMFVEGKDKVTQELELLKNDFQYTVATAESAGKSIEKKIQKDFENLSMTLQQPDWNEEEVILLIKVIRRNIVELSSIR